MQMIKWYKKNILIDKSVQLEFIKSSFSYTICLPFSPASRVSEHCIECDVDKWVAAHNDAQELVGF